MELRQLRYFIATAHYLNFSRAAESLYITQPALSHQIAALEQELKTPLFLRDRHSVKLTPEGVKLLEYAKEIMGKVDAMQHFSSSNPVLEAKPLRIGLDGPDEPAHWIDFSRTIAGFLNRYPSVQLTSVYTNNQRCDELVAEQELDLAVINLRHNESLDSRLDYKMIQNDALVLVVHSDTNVTTADEAVQCLPMTVIKDRTKALIRVKKALADLGQTPTLSYQDTMSACLILTQAGRASMIMTKKQFYALPPNNLRMIPLPGQQVKISRLLIWNKYSTNGAVHLFLDYANGRF